MFMTALAVSRAWERNLEKVHETRHYDVEVRFETPAERRGLAALASVAGVRRVEAWGSAPAAFSRPGQLDVSRTYADGSHGSLYALAPPRDQRSIELPLVEGRWLPDDAPDAIVLNHGAYAQAGRPPIGAVLRLSIDGAPFEGHLAGVVEEIGSPGAAYLHPETFERVTGTEARSSMLRITSDAHGGAERDEVLRRLERALEGLSVEAVTPFSELRTAIGDHVGILIQALVAMALIMAVVGILGLVSAMGASVVERTRELGILKAVGADERTIVGLFVQEGLVIAALSWALATTISLPLTGLVDALVGQLGFLAPLPFVLAPSGIAGWAGLLAIAAVLATLVPALRAARMTVHEALREP